jgi:hypothetical protein
MLTTFSGLPWDQHLARHPCRLLPQSYHIDRHYFAFVYWTPFLLPLGRLVYGLDAFASACTLIDLFVDSIKEQLLFYTLCHFSAISMLL